MYLSTVLLSLLAAPIAVFAQNGQVNFYWDADCQDYASSAYPAPASSPGAGNVVGGPDGAESMLWVYANPDSGCNGAYPLWCKDTECNAYDVASYYVCKHFENGVWAEYWQTCGE